MLLRGDRTDGALIAALGGPPARWAVSGGAGGPEYWLRVWGARGLLYAWQDDAAEPVIAALGDEHWRVREMAAKVCARRLLDEAVPLLGALRHDDDPRVRRSAERARLRITDADGR